MPGPPAGQKLLSQITPAGAPPALTDQLVGVAGGTTDNLYTLAQVRSAASPPPMVDAGIVHVSGLANGFSYTIPNNVWHVVLNGTGALSIGTITMPSSPVDGQVIRLKTMQLNITGLTVAPNIGQIVNNFPHEMSQFSYFEATYDASNTTWYLEYIEKLFAESDLTWYVNPNTGTNPGWGVGNDANSGLSITTPFFSLPHAVNVALSFNYQGFFNPFIVLGDGTYQPGGTGTGALNINQPLEAGGSGVLRISQSPGANVRIVANASGQAWFTSGATVALGGTINFVDTGLNPEGTGSFLCGSTVTLTFTYTGTQGTFSPFFFDPGGGITLNNSTITLIGQFWDAFVFMNEGGSNFTMNGCHVNLPAIMDVSGYAFVFGLNFSYSQSNITWTNFGGVVGQNINTFESTVYAGGGDLSAIPGNVVPYWDFSDLLLRNVIDAQGFTFGFGTPLDNTTIAQYNWSVLQDSTNNCYLALKDINGVTRVKRIGRQPNTRTANYVLAFTDQDGRVEMNLAGANTVTVPLHATVPFSVGTEVKVTQIGAGVTTIIAAGGVTTHNFGALAAQWATAVLYQRATDEWVMTGA